MSEENPTYQPTPEPAPIPAATQAPSAYNGVAAPHTNTMAIVGLVLSIASFIGLSLLGSIPGVILGHIARKQIRTSGEQGDGLARAALIVGYISIGLSILGGIALIVLVIVLAAAGHNTSDCIRNASSVHCSFNS